MPPRVCLCECWCVCLCCPSGPALETSDKAAAVPLRDVSDALGPLGSLDGHSPTRGAAWGGGRSAASCSLCCTRSHHAAFQKGFRDGVWGLANALQWPESVPLRLLPPHLALRHRRSFHGTFLSQGLPETAYLSAGLAVFMRGFSLRGRANLLLINAEPGMLQVQRVLQEPAPAGDTALGSSPRRYQHIMWHWK